MVDLQRRCETCEERAMEGLEDREEVSEPMVKSERVRVVLGGVERVDLRSGKADGDAR